MRHAFTFGLNCIHSFIVSGSAVSGGCGYIPGRAFPYFRIRNNFLHVEHISYVIMSYGQHQWIIPSLFSKFFRPCWRKALPQKYYHCLLTGLTKFCFSILVLLYAVLSLSFLLTFFWLGFHCSMRLCFSPGNWSSVGAHYKLIYSCLSWSVHLMGALTFLFLFYSFFLKINYDL